ncbi:hypothetical protein Asp14428_67610 [Actinoplanes sp. NBRC 14428]|nr:hypothetical protein Asp14428_67610 [Actinoplanes sp. NBRC 14428]
MSSKRKFKLASLAVTVGLVSSALVAPAAAHAAFADCPQEIYCLWTEFDGTGGALFTATDQPDLRARNLNDVISSVNNTSSTRGLCLYPDINYKSVTWMGYVPPKTSMNLEADGLDNALSSVKWAPTNDAGSCR